MIIWIFAIVVLAGVGKLIYDIQQKKKENKESKNEFDKDALQKLAGIIPTNPNDEVRQFLVNNNIIDEEKLKEEFKDVQFPAPDPSIPVTTAKLTTIGGSYGDSDPLASVPMSRVSNEGKKKMAEIAKQDISEQLEQNAEKFSALIESEKPKTKKKNPKQDIKGVDESKPFKKTRKKATKKKKENE
jgi:hypothetical protein